MHLVEPLPVEGDVGASIGEVKARLERAEGDLPTTVSAMSSVAGPPRSR